MELPMLIGRVPVSGSRFLRVEFQAKRGIEVVPHTQAVARAHVVCHVAIEPGAREAEGTAFCSTKDPFSYAKGRKLAFARAVQKLTKSKAKRAELWAAIREAEVF